MYDNLLVGTEINPIQTENVPITPEVSSQSNVNIPVNDNQPNHSPLTYRTRYGRISHKPDRYGY